MLAQGRQTTGEITPMKVDVNGNVGISAVDLTTTGGKIKLDASGHVIIDGESPSLLRPVPKSARFQNLFLPVGASIQTVVTVPANEVWRLTEVTMLFIGAVVGNYLIPIINNTSNQLNLSYFNPIVSGAVYISACSVLLNSGWSIQCAVGNAALNDDLYVDYFTERVY